MANTTRLAALRLPTTRSRTAESIRLEPLLDPAARALLILWLVCCTVAFVLPYPPTKVAVGLVLGASYLHASLKHPYLALCGFVLLLPFSDTAYKGSLLVPGINIQTLFVVYLFLIAGVSPRSPKTPTGRHPLVLPLMLLFGLMLTSALGVALTTGASAFALLTAVKATVAYSLLTIIAFRHVRESKHKVTLLLCVFGGVLINVLFSLKEVSQTLASGRIFMRHRAVSLISDQPNLYGGFLALYLLFFVAFFAYYPMSRRVRLIGSAVTLLVAINLVYTMSRGAWLACCVTILLVASTRARRLTVPVALLGFALYFWLPDMAVERGGTVFSGEYDPQLLVTENHAEVEDAATRIVQWRSFLPMMAEHPVFGAGYGSFSEFFRSGGYYPVAKGAHSSIIEIGVELGPMGLLLYAWLLFAAYTGGTRVFKGAKHPIERVLGLGLLSATLCLFLLDLTGTRFRNGNIMAYYWILAGMTLNALGQVATRSAPVALPRFASRAGNRLEK